MGCGGSITEWNGKGIPEDDFNFEAYSSKFYIDQINKNGIKVKDLRKNNVYFNSINALFEEEDMMNGKEDAELKPWLKTIYKINPDLLKNQVTKKKFNDEQYYPPKFDLQIDHIFGFHIDDIRNNIFFIDNDNILFTASTCAIVHNIYDNTQKIFGCDKLYNKTLDKNKSSELLCHNDQITAIDYYNSQDMSFVATGQRGDKPMILLWSPIDCKTIYAKYYQNEDSFEVSDISIDKSGKYIASFGKDKYNTFYIYDLQKQKIIWEEKTNEDYLLQIRYGYTNYNKDNKDEICMVGKKKIIFANLKKRKFHNIILYMNEPEFNKNIYTCCKYLHLNDNEGYEVNVWLIGTYDGKILQFNNKNNNINFSKLYNYNGSIETIMFDDISEKFIVSDAKNYVYLVSFNKDGFLKVVSKMKFESTVKAISMSKKGLTIYGFKNGYIKLFNPNNGEEVSSVTFEDIVVSHCFGGIFGIDKVDEKRFVSVGEDNKIILYNYKVNKAEDVGYISCRNDVEQVKGEDRYFLKYNYLDNHKAWCVSYNLTKDNLAIGLYNGNVSIRRSIKYLSEKLLEDIKITPGYPISILKYTPYGDYLTVASTGSKLFILDPNDDYLIKYKLDDDLFILPKNVFINNFDYENNKNYIRCTTNSNNFYIFTFPELENKPDKIEQEINFKENTCKFTSNVQGIFSGNDDPSVITCCAKEIYNNILCTGDNRHCLNIYDYPVIHDNSLCKSYYAHSYVISQILFLSNTKVVTIGGNDKSIFVWNIIKTKK